MDTEKEFDTTLITAVEARAILGMTANHFRKIQREPGFPKGVRPSKRAMYFLHEIKDWIKNLPRAK